MDRTTVFCPNQMCPARGQRNQGNIWIHSQKEHRYRCTVCGKTFAARKGTALYRLHKAEDLMTMVITLLAHGCPVAAIVVAFMLDERTVAAWQARAGHLCERVHQALVEQPRDLGQVQADEMRAYEATNGQLETAQQQIKIAREEIDLAQKQLEIAETTRKDQLLPILYPKDIRCIQLL